MLRRKNAFAFANSLGLNVINQPPADFSVLSPEIQQAIGNMFTGSADETIVAIVQAIQKHQDSCMHVCSEVYPDDSDVNAFPVYFRDGRHLQTNENPYHPFAIMGLQAFMAARKLASLAGIPDIDEHFRIADAKLFYDRISQNTANDKPEYDLARYIDHCILPQLMDALCISKEEALKRLHTAKDFCNFEYRTQAVATLTVHQDSSNQPVHVLQVDVPIIELNENLIREYQQRNQREWYRLLQAWQKQLIDHYSDAILNGKVIPTQCRKYLPGLRNAAEEKIFILQVQPGADPVEIYHVYHSGNLGHLTKGDNEKLTGFAVDQLKQAIKCSHLHVVTLTSPITKGAKMDQESVLDHQVNLAVKSRMDEVTASVIPVNILRHFTLNNTNTSWMMLKAENLLKKVMPGNLNEQNLTGREFWLCDLESSLPINAENFYFIQLIRAAKSLREARYGSDSDVDGNRHLEIACGMMLLAFYYEKCCEQLNDANFKPFAVDIFCKSGKDRTGFVDLLAISYAVANYLSKDKPLSYENLLSLTTKIMTQSQHAQRRAGDVGATLGAEGFVPSLEFALSDRFKEATLRDLILLKAAKYNKKYPCLSDIKIGNDQQARLYEECTKARRDLNEAVSRAPAHEDMTIVANELVNKTQRVYASGKVGVDEAPVLTNLLQSAKNLLTHQDPGSAAYSIELRRFSRLTKEVVGKPSIGKIIGGVALALLGVGIIAAAVALGIPSGGISLGGVVIGALLIKAAVGLAAGTCILGGTLFAVHGRKKEVALQGERFLEVAEEKRTFSMERSL